MPPKELQETVLDTEGLESFQTGKSKGPWASCQGTRGEEYGLEKQWWAQ